MIGVHKSTVSREIRCRKRKDGEYKADTAEHKAGMKRWNSKYQGMKIEQSPLLRKRIISELRKYQSPECSAGRMLEEKVTPRVSSDAIYRWLRSAYGQRYCKYLCTKRYKKEPHKDTPKRQMIPNMTSIHNVPLDSGLVTEGDTFLSPRKVSKVSAVLVVWRETKLLKGGIVKNLRPLNTRKVMMRIHAEYKSDLLILDQGGENREHEQFGVQVLVQARNRRTE